MKAKEVLIDRKFDMYFNEDYNKALKWLLLL